MVPRGPQVGHGGSRKDTWVSAVRIVFDFGMIWELHFESFLGTEGVKLFCFVGLVSGLLFIPIFELTSGCLGLLNRGSLVEGITKNSISQRLNAGVRFHFFKSFWCPWGHFL